MTPTVAAGNVANEVETSQRHNDDDDLFTSSIDTTSSAVSKGSKSKHKHKKKAGRSGSQLSNASSQSSQKESKTTSNKDGKWGIGWIRRCLFVSNGQFYFVDQVIAYTPLNCAP